MSEQGQSAVASKPCGGNFRGRAQVIPSWSLGFLEAQPYECRRVRGRDGKIVVQSSNSRRTGGCARGIATHTQGYGRDDAASRIQLLGMEGGVSARESKERESFRTGKEGRLSIGAKRHQEEGSGQKALAPKRGVVEKYFAGVSSLQRMLATV